MTFWSGLIGGLFFTAATHGTDQMMVQRYLTARSQRSASCGLGTERFCHSRFAIHVVPSDWSRTRLLLSRVPTRNSLWHRRRGQSVFTFYRQSSPGRGLVGLTLSAVFAAAMSTLSGSLNSSATASSTTSICRSSKRSSCLATKAIMDQPGCDCWIWCFADLHCV